MENYSCEQFLLSIALNPRTCNFAPLIKIFNFDLPFKMSSRTNAALQLLSRQIFGARSINRSVKS
jgi:hypothetical protein